VHTVEGWPDRSRVAAAASLIADTERCPGCGLTGDDAWTHTAQLEHCPTCEQRDRLTDVPADRAGRRVRFRMLTSETERMTESAAVGYTLEGRKAQVAWRRGRTG